MLKNYKPILIVPGDPKSIFLEIFFKSFRKSKKTIILICNKELLTKQMKILKFNYKLNQITVSQIYNKDLNNNRINFINISLDPKKINEYINKCFEMSLQILKKDKEISLINGPINKTTFLKQKYLGITEFLGTKTGVLKNVVMLIFNKNLAVSPLTTHIPLKDVHLQISKKKILNHAIQINNFYKFKFKKNPKIAITGLNPHCESNFKTSEEKRIIIPAIKSLKTKNFKVSGPFAADTIFLKNNYKKFDVIIGMYHDQVLTPIKSIFGFKAINITLGLPFLRISPDHGPNIKMFGKNISNPDSLREAIKFLN